jgi:class 3 adenylate cyclase/HAMP domain-containing protein
MVKRLMTRLSRVFYFSFAAKLTLAMTLLIAGISFTTLFITQNRFYDISEEYSNEQFVRQLETLRLKQEERLRSIAEVIESETTEVRPQVALAEDEIDRFYYDISVSLAGFAATFEHRQNEFLEFQPFFRYVDANKKFWTPNAELVKLAGSTSHLGARWLEEMLSSLVNDQWDNSRFRFGYKVFSSGEKSVVYELILVPIFLLENDQYRGELVFGVPMLEGNRSSGKSDESIKNGLMVETLFSSDTPDLAGIDAVLNNLFVNKSSGETNSYNIWLGDTEYLVFSQALAVADNFPRSHFVSLFSLASLNQMKSRLRSLLLLVIFPLALIAGLVVSYFLSKRLTRPIYDIVGGLQAISDSRFDVEIPVRSNDELGYLALSYNEFRLGMEQKEKFRSILDLVVDKGIASEILSGKIELGGELRKVSILFCDLRGFTKLTDGMDPRDVVKMVNEHMTLMTQVIHKHGGVVDKFIGDEIMALFGTFKPTGSDGLKASQCALEMVEVRRKFNQSRKLQLEIGVGIASGEVLAGYMGSTSRLNYTVLGDRVNLAARLTGKAGPMEVFIDQATQEELDSEFSIEQVRNLELKGFKDIKFAYKIHLKNPYRL